MTPTLLHYFQNPARNAWTAVMDSVTEHIWGGRYLAADPFHVELRLGAPSLLQRPEAKEWPPSFQREAWGFGKLLSNPAQRLTLLFLPTRFSIQTQEGAKEHR